MLQIRRLSFIAATVAFVLLSQAAQAQSPEADEPINVRIMALEETAATEDSVGTMEVTVSAVDEDGLPLQGLTPDNFRVALEDAQLNVRDIRTPDAGALPAYVVLLVDVSLSMQGEPIEQARSAISDFVQALEPNDQIAIVSFAGQVTQVQDFTSDRAQLDAAISNLQLAVDTALFDAVVAGSEVISGTPEGRRIVVLLSDGVATVGLENRQASLAAADAADVGIVTVALGQEVDIDYLTDLAEASDGRLLEAPTPAALSQAYRDLANAIRSQYTLVIDVPPSIDRTVSGTLRVHGTVNADFSTTERLLTPLDGALPPPFDLNLTGLTAGQEVEEPLSLEARPFDARQIVSAQYLLDGENIHSAEGDSLTYTFDPAGLGPGNHTLTVIARDSTGKPGRIDVPFIVPEAVVAAPSRSLPVMPLLAVGLGVAALYLLIRVINKRRRQMPTYVSDRVKPWADRGSPLPSPAEALPERAERQQNPPEPVAESPMGRLVVMNEGAIRGGELSGIREYQLYRSPLTFGTGDHVDVRVEDDTGLIAAEEARLWVQRGRLVYHKLTTLSAMATEGVTAGWQFLEHGEELRVSSYRLLFQVLEQEKGPEESQDQPAQLPQEHGMDLRRAWQAVNDMPHGSEPPPAPSISQFTDLSLEQNQAAAPPPSSRIPDSFMQGGGQAADTPPLQPFVPREDFGSWASASDEEDEEEGYDSPIEDWQSADPFSRKDLPPHDSGPIQGESDYRSA